MSGCTHMHAHAHTHAHTTYLVRLLESHSGEPYGGWEGQWATQCQEKVIETREVREHAFDKEMQVLNEW